MWYTREQYSAMRLSGAISMGSKKHRENIYILEFLNKLEKNGPRGFSSFRKILDLLGNLSIMYFYRQTLPLMHQEDIASDAFR